MSKKNIVVSASSAKTATWTEDINTDGAESLYLHVSVTVDPASASVTFTISSVNDVGEGETPLLVTLLESAAVDSVTTAVYKVGPALTASANLIAKEYLPQNVRITATHADSDSITYSVSAQLA